MMNKFKTGEWVRIKSAPLLIWEVVATMSNGVIIDREIGSRQWRNNDELVPAQFKVIKTNSSSFEDFYDGQV